MKKYPSQGVFYLEQFIAFFFGASIFAISLTQLRGGGRIGPFEILLVLLSITWLLVSIPARPNAFKFSIDLIPITYFLCILLPVTVLSVFLQSNGANFTELAAYLLCGIIAFISFRKCEIYSETMIYGLVAAIIFYSSYLVLTGSFFGISAEEVYGSRWRGASKNPNQTSLYSIVAIGLMSLRLNRKYFILPLVLSLMLALRAFSDAFLGGMLIGGLLALFAAIFIHGGKILKTLSWAFFLPLIIFIVIIYIPEFPVFFDAIMDEADEGGGRITLAKNGALAFLHSPVIGNGAGAFSGGYFPFDGAEAHNTLIDFAAIGGVILPIIFYSIFALALNIRIKQKSYFDAWILSAFIIFSLAHFIGRHPIVWVYWSYNLYDILKFYEIPLLTSQDKS